MSKGNNMRSKEKREMVELKVKLKFNITAEL